MSQQDRMFIQFKTTNLIKDFEQLSNLELGDEIIHITDNIPLVYIFSGVSAKNENYVNLVKNNNVSDIKVVHSSKVKDYYLSKKYIDFLFADRLRQERLFEKLQRTIEMTIKEIDEEIEHPTNLD